MRVLRTFLVMTAIVVISASSRSGEPIDTARHRATLLTFGDVNFGRYVGKKLLQGDTLYPFRKIRPVLTTADIVFVNLESQLSDQGGETQDPKNNLIFTGPPEGAVSLAQSGITIVSTANNHAYDYGFEALKETIENLDSSNIQHIGTSTEPGQLYLPVLMKISGITIAFFAVTELMNVPCCDWKPYIAWADSSRLFPAIRAIHDSVDMVIVSYHGDEEYKEKPTRKQKNFFHWLIDTGVDIVLGHHSHVLQGIEEYHGGWCVYSMGNFVFAQPQREWTQRSAGIRWQLEKKSGRASIGEITIIPIRTGFQPSEVDNTRERDKILERINRLSNVRFPWSLTASIQIH